MRSWRGLGVAGVPLRVALSVTRKTTRGAGVSKAFIELDSAPEIRTARGEFARDVGEDELAAGFETALRGDWASAGHTLSGLNPLR